MEKHGRQAWVNFRLQKIENVQDQKCHECGFYFQYLCDHYCDQNLKYLTGSEVVGATYPCPECHQSFSVANGILYNHLRMVHSVRALLKFRTVSIKGIQDYQCPKCKIYMNQRRVDHNCAEIIEQLEEYGITPQPSGGGDGGTHDYYSTHSNEYPCPHCKEIFPVRTRGLGLHRHIRKAHGDRKHTLFRSEKVEGVHTTKCSVCNFWFAGKIERHPCAEQRQFYEQYVLNNDDGDDDDEEDEDDNSDQDKITPRVSGLMATCPFPTQRSCTNDMDLSRLYSHILTVHGRTKWLAYRRQPVPGLREWKCEHCEFYFADSRRHSCREYQKYKLRMYSTSAQSEGDDNEEISRIKCHVSGCGSQFGIYKSYLEHCERKHGEMAWAKAVTSRTPGHAEFRCPKCTCYVNTSFRHYMYCDKYKSKLEKALGHETVPDDTPEDSLMDTTGSALSTTNDCTAENGTTKPYGIEEGTYTCPIDSCVKGFTTKARHDLYRHIKASHSLRLVFKLIEINKFYSDWLTYQGKPALGLVSQ